MAWLIFNVFITSAYYITVAIEEGARIVNLPRGSGIEQLSNIVNLSMQQYRSLFDELKKMNFDMPVTKYSLRKALDNSGLLSFINTRKNTRNNTNDRALFSKNPLQDIVKGVTSVIARFTGRRETEDYTEVVKGFIPFNSQLLKPRFPRKSSEIQLADLNGDSREELIASYKYQNALKTVILKKQSGLWIKAAEINHPEHEEVNIRTVEDIAGDGKMHLLIGLTSRNKQGTMYGYSMGSDGIVKKNFSRNYDWAEITTLAKTRVGPSYAHMALWTRDENGMYDIDVLTWNGLLLEPALDSSTYYARRVVPYYIRKIRTNPTSGHGWYRLAEALKLAGANRDSGRIVDAAMRQYTDPLLRDKFFKLL